MISKNYDAIIIGAGIIGNSIAYTVKTETTMTQIRCNTG